MASADAAGGREHGGGQDAPKPPPAGFRLPGSDASGTEIPRIEDLERLLVLAREFRGLIPSELDARLLDAAHELLLALRALIDWMLEREELQRSEPVEVHDIPIS